MIQFFKKIQSSNCEVTDNAIALLKEKSIKAMESFRSSDIQRKESIADYFYVKFSESKDVPFDVLDLMEEGQPVPLPVVHGGSVLTTKQTIDEEEEIRYHTQWTSGSTLTWHFHSDCYEIITVTEGTFKVYLPNDEKMILKDGDTLRIAVNIPHQVTALTKGKLIVDFIKI